MSATGATYQQIRESLLNAGIKATQQRIAIYSSMLQIRNHPNAEEIYEEVKKSNPSLSLGTVYKTLDTFVSSGMIQKVFTKNECMRYEVDQKDHNHIYCTNTDEIVDYHNEELDELIKDFLSKKKINNLEITGIHLQINGKKIDLDKSVHIS